MTERIAVTVIGGYLGAGKTTLLNHVLREAEERIAVLVNDFGDINIDLDLIESRTDDTIELSNGCICCSIVDGFAAALDRIVALEPRPERLVIETSGVADPAQVAAYGHGPGLALDAVVVLVDAETIRTSVDDRYLGQTMRSHLAAAEVLVVNKADLVTARELSDTVDWLSNEWPDAFVVTTTDARVSSEVLFGRASTRDVTAVPSLHHHPEQLFTSDVRTIDGPTNHEAIAELMAELGDATVRAKGLVWVEESDTPWVLQRVGRRWTLRPTTRPWPREPATEIVVISRRSQVSDSTAERN